MSTDISNIGKAAKQWSVSTTSVANEPLQMYCAGKPLTQSAPATLEAVSPVEHLLLSIATCFALSCRAAFAMKKFPLPVFDVNVLGTKALKLPSRLQSIDIEVVFSEGVSTSTAAAITADAKRLCTVTNTLHASPVTMSIESRVDGGISTR